jgi:hypothetical protein
MRTIVAHSVLTVAAAALVGLQILTSAGADASVTGAGHPTFTTTNPCALQNIHVLPPPPSPGGRVMPSSGPIKANPTPTPQPQLRCFALDLQIIPNVGHGYVPAKCHGPSPADLSFSSNRSSDFYHGTTGADCWIHGSFQVPFGSTLYLWTTDPDCGAVGPIQLTMPANRTGFHPGNWDPSTGALVLVVYPSCPEPPPPPPQG